MPLNVPNAMAQVRIFIFFVIVFQVPLNLSSVNVSRFIEIL